MKYVTAQRMKQLDQTAITQYGIPSFILMENAGRGIADLAETLLTKARQNVLVVCGKGNNGGDGLVAARHLANRGYSVCVAILAGSNELKDDPKLNYNILRKMRVPIECITSKQLPRFKTLIQKSNLVLDGIFGVGLKRSVGGFFYDVISILNASKRRILAIDIPSGLHSDSGKVLGIAIRAKATGTLGAPKRGLFVNDGPKCSGKIKVIDISIPAVIAKRRLK